MIIDHARSDSTSLSECFTYMSYYRSIFLNLTSEFGCKDISYVKHANPQPFLSIAI